MEIADISEVNYSVIELPSFLLNRVTFSGMTVTMHPVVDRLSPVFHRFFVTESREVLLVSLFLWKEPSMQTEGSVIAGRYEALLRQYF